MSKLRSITAISIFSVCLAILFPLFFLTISADSSASPPKIAECAAACIFDKTHNKILFIENGNKTLNTSTSAKVMMGLLSCELLSERLDEKVTLTDSMLSGASGYSMKLKAGEEITVRDLLYGAICGSYNDAAYAVASLCAESAADFVSLMNKKAAALGASATNYTNPLGHPDNSSMVTTLADTLKIATAASENELYMEICSAKSFTLSATNISPRRTIFNRNRLIYTPSGASAKYYNPVCIGMNAGSSGDAGGWSVITLAEDDGADLICILLGGKESDDGEIYAYKAANSLIDWACKSYDSISLYRAGDILGKAEITMTAFGSQNAEYTAASDLDVYIPSERKNDVELRVEYTDGELKAPIKAGERIGSVIAYLDGEMVGSCDIMLSEDCEANAIIKVIDALGNYTKSRAFFATAVFLVIVLPIAIIVTKRRNSLHRRRKRRY